MLGIGFGECILILLLALLILGPEHLLTFSKLVGRVFQQGTAVIEQIRAELHINTKDHFPKH